MALTRQARICFRLMAAVNAVGLAPAHDKMLARPMRKRLEIAPPKLLVGRIPTVGVVDQQVRMRDGQAIRIRIYRRPEGSSDVPLVYAHGGGFVMGGVPGCDHICRRLAAQSGAVVVSVEYRLAPEHPFPGPLRDLQDATAWVLGAAEELGVDPARLVVGGDSAGGNLAAALSLSLRDQGKPPAGQILVYPSLDLTLSSPGIRTYNGIGLTVEQCQRLAADYLQDHDPHDPSASPLLAADFRGLPPTLVVTVEHDPLRDEGHRYVMRCRDADVPVQHLDLPDHVHGSLSLPRLYRGVDEIYQLLSDFIKDPSASAARPARHDRPVSPPLRPAPTIAPRPPA